MQHRLFTTSQSDSWALRSKYPWPEDFFLRTVENGSGKATSCKITNLHDFHHRWLLPGPSLIKSGGGAEIGEDSEIGTHFTADPTALDAS